MKAILTTLLTACLSGIGMAQSFNVEIQPRHHNRYWRDYDQNSRYYDREYHHYRRHGGHYEIREWTDDYGYTHRRRVWVSPVYE